MRGKLLFPDENPNSIVYKLETHIIHKSINQASERDSGNKGKRYHSEVEEQSGQEPRKVPKLSRSSNPTSSFLEQVGLNITPGSINPRGNTPPGHIGSLINQRSSSSVSPTVPPHADNDIE